ncbi:SRPBCC family protein [Terricaulis silvestris]|uniref:Polyketide cyclase / dehydrase and lipid transport n=1 Tax=Terricaulis silvestris TaxID=2686094 RepID=A0A6I6ML35_9CAUL|nr:SRPBCC domain-containing protein [Terricaulis silvestris]QGZ95409.1 Polyketide cyclase / dehydrase and lipid transport [Terricaulis silvestris]
MHGLSAIFALAFACFAAPVHAQEVTRCDGGERVLCHEIVVAAPAAEVWRLISTAEGFSTWAAPVVAIDLRVGGAFESSYNRNARIGDAGNIHNRVVAFAPETLLVIQIADAPPGFPHGAEARELTTVMAVEPVDATHARLRVSMMGFREGEAFDALFAFFDRGNAWTLQKLNERVMTGPVDWARQEGAR